MRKWPGCAPLMRWSRLSRPNSNGPAAVDPVNSTIVEKAPVVSSEEEAIFPP